MSISPPRNGRLPGMAALSVLALGTANAQQEDTSQIHHDEVDEIVVRAAALERGIKELAQPTAILDGNDLIRKQSASLGRDVVE